MIDPYSAAAKMAVRVTALAVLVLTLTVGYYTIQGLRGRLSVATAKVQSLEVTVGALKTNADEVMAIMAAHADETRARQAENRKLKEAIANAKVKPIPEKCIAAVADHMRPIAAGLDWLRDNSTAGVAGVEPAKP